MRCLVLATLLVVASGCAAPDRLVKTKGCEKVCEYEGITHHHLCDNLIDDPNSQFGVYFNLLKAVGPDGDVGYFIEMMHRVDDGMLIPETATLFLSVDREKYALFGCEIADSLAAPEMETQALGAAVMKRSLYKASPELLWQLAMASRVHVKLKGETQSHECECSNASLRNIRYFVEEHVGSPRRENEPQLSD